MARFKRTSIICPHLYQVPRVVKYIETESRIMVTRACWGGRNEELLFNEYRVSVWDNETVWRQVV